MTRIIHEPRVPPTPCHFLSHNLGDATMSNGTHPAEQIDIDLIYLLQEKIREKLEDYFDGNASAEKSFLLLSMLKMLCREEME